MRSTLTLESSNAVLPLILTFMLTDHVRRLQDRGRRRAREVTEPAAPVEPTASDAAPPGSVEVQPSATSNLEPVPVTMAQPSEVTAAPSPDQPFAAGPTLALSPHPWAVMVQGCSRLEGYHPARRYPMRCNPCDGTGLKNTDQLDDLILGWADMSTRDLLDAVRALTEPTTWCPATAAGPATSTRTPGTAPGRALRAARPAGQARALRLQRRALRGATESRLPGLTRITP